MAGDPIQWQGDHRFLISGTDRDDTTLRVAANGREDLYTLELPTLAITYADMAFAERIGGRQVDWPDSREYGVFFEPPVELVGGEEIENLTWIRGAEEVSIGPRRTLIRWRGFRDLVIPRLRLEASAEAPAVLSVPEVVITVEQPLEVDLLQSIDGRPVGGLSVVKRHPEWEEEAEPDTFDLWVAIVEAESGRELAGAEVRLWDRVVRFGGELRGWRLQGEWRTDDSGVLEVEGLALAGGDQEGETDGVAPGKLVVVAAAGPLPATWRFLPLPGGRAARGFRMSAVRRSWVSYRWREGDTLAEISKLVAAPAEEMLERNGVGCEEKLVAGQRIEIPAIEPGYLAVAGDSLEGLASRFGYSGAEELAELTGLDPEEPLYVGQEVRLPGWRFFVAPSELAFEELDERFGVPPGWSRPVLDTFHDDPRRCQPGEPVAVPSPELVERSPGLP